MGMEHFLYVGPMLVGYGPKENAVEVSEETDDLWCPLMSAKSDNMHCWVPNGTLNAPIAQAIAEFSDMVSGAIAFNADMEKELDAFTTQFAEAIEIVKPFYEIGVVSFGVVSYWN